MKLFSISLALFFIILSAFASAATTHEVGQKDKNFTVKNLTIKKGDKVKFVNQDDIFHNVFSLSDAAFFDLGSFPKGEFKEVVFEEKGEVEVECAIHPNMKMVVTVED